MFNRFTMDSNPEAFSYNPSVFTSKTVPYTGSFAKLMLRHPLSYRSTHPTNSIVSIGRHASYITARHTPLSSSYSFIQDLADLSGKFLSIGCVSSSPAFTSTHYAQYLNGYATKSIYSRIYGTFYLNAQDEKKLFLRHDIGGHNGGAHKLYADYLKHDLLQVINFGASKAASACIKEILARDIEIIRNNQNNFCSNVIVFHVVPPGLII